MDINLVINIISAIGTLIAAVVAWKTLGQMRKEQKDGLYREKQQATLDAFNVLQQQVFDEINKYSVNQIKEIVQNKRSQEYKILSGYLARIEHFCVGLNRDIYDIYTFYDLCSGYFDSDRGILMPRILPIIESKNVNMEKDYFENLHRVWKRMDIITEENKARIN